MYIQRPLQKTTFQGESSEHDELLYCRTRSEDAMHNEADLQ